MSALKFRKRPVVIMALQYDGKNLDEVIKFVGKDSLLGVNEGSRRFAISTLEGAMSVSDGDWIIRGVQGEFYPCKPDIFEETYEPVD